MTALLVVIQIVFFIVQLIILKSYSVYINIGLTILSIVVGAYIISRDMNPSIKLAWIVPIMMFPLFGGLLYILYAPSGPSAEHGRPRCTARYKHAVPVYTLPGPASRSVPPARRTVPLPPWPPPSARAGILC